MRAGAGPDQGVERQGHSLRRSPARTRTDGVAASLSVGASPTSWTRQTGGQASVELVLVLPLVALLLLALLQTGLVLRDQLLVVQAAREGAREAAVSPQRARVEAAVRRAAPGLKDGLEVLVDRGPRTGDLATVAVRALPARVPAVGRVLGGHRLEASATMRVERSGT